MTRRHKIKLNPEAVRALYEAAKRINRSLDLIAQAIARGIEDFAAKVEALALLLSRAAKRAETRRKKRYRRFVKALEKFREKQKGGGQVK